MPRRLVTIASASGLHARPASLFTRAAAATGHEITIGRPDEEPVDASSILLVMSLGLSRDEDVVLESHALEAETALDDLAALLGTDLDAA
ncbi:HPr family phosphocarrier protein [Sanguibacter inulinus]|uniref:Phosphocarrier protein HPr n=1 Tax=Sanguibacter inulinus TaxID=60922 RepID=A0A853ETW7_9MICO|nr:HPr family phosphocarrier protein [Sanguibacter inulinus]MBF0721173.1 HPr family phosphocarrier protein [Sanguibacter inulinus]NYS92318.1 HPr family phosphocarrier protein [Sanguibacter inulinus]